MLLPLSIVECRTGYIFYKHTKIVIHIAILPYELPLPVLFVPEKYSGSVIITALYIYIYIYIDYQFAA